MPQLRDSSHGWQARPGYRGGVVGGMDLRGDSNLQAAAWAGRMEAIAAHPLAELLECPPTVRSLLNGSAASLDFESGETVFRQNAPCKGLYVIASGSFVRKAERIETHLNLGPARAGDLVELAAVLGDGRHTYSLVAQSAGSMLLLPGEALSRAFQAHPPLRMHLLEELAREVSRAYNCCSTSRRPRGRRKILPAEA